MPEPTPPRGRVGRPPRLSRDLIIQTAHDIGLADLSLKAVADRLDVSVASLYHHVDGRDELARLTAEYGATRTAVPVDRGQHWAVWLREWAVHVNRSFRAQPQLLERYLAGAIAVNATATNLDAVYGLLERAGFDAALASHAYELVSNYAIGAAAAYHHVAGTGRVAADREVPHLRRVETTLAKRRGMDFEQRVDTILAGIAARKGEPWEPIAKILAADRAGRRRRATRAR